MAAGGRCLVGADAQNTSKALPRNYSPGRAQQLPRALMPDQGTFMEGPKLHEMPRQLRASVSSSVHRENRSTFLLRLLGG